MMTLKSLFYIIATVLIAAQGQANQTAKTVEKEPYKIRWLLAHEPLRVFERAAKEFKKDVEEKSNGQIQVEILNTKEYLAKYLKDKKYYKHSYLDDVALIKDGQIEMTQAYTTELGRLNRKMHILDLPFLFRDHAHAKKIIDGEVGQQLLASLQEQNVKGLSFTYSGGYRVISTRESGINKVEDFKNLSIRISRSPVTRAMYQLLGAKSLELTHEDGIKKVQEGKLTAAETTIARFDEKQQKATPIINDTQHSLFLTSMVVNQKFYNSLPENLKTIVSDAARKAAELERQDSLKDEKDLRNVFASKGVKVVTMPKNEVEKFKQITRPLYDQFKKEYGSDIIVAIEQTK